MQTLPQNWIDVLVNLPESGMNYQIVDITFKNGFVLDRMVFRSESVFLPQGYDVKDIIDIKMSKDCRLGG